MQNIIKVTESGDTNLVEIISPQKGSYIDQHRFETDWPSNCLLALADLKGEWFLDSYQRFEHPNYVQKQIDFILDYYGVSLKNKIILDFGCGFGASTYCLLNRGADNITISELEDDNLNFCSSFLEQRGFSNSFHVQKGDMIPTMENNSFDIIWLQAVVEHLLPDERYEYLQTFWRALKSKGILIITEVPNRLWPVERHTTGGTWFLPWKKPESIFNAMRQTESFKNYSNVDFYRSGIVGVSYRDILQFLGNPKDCTQLSLQITGYLKKYYARATEKTALKTLAVNSVDLFEPLLQKIFNRPLSAFMPFLQHLAFQKQ